MNKLSDIEAEHAVAVELYDDPNYQAALAVKQQQSKDEAERIEKLKRDAGIAQRLADIAELDADFHSLSNTDTLEDVKKLCERMAELRVSDAQRLIFYDLVKQSKISGATKSAAKTFHDTALADIMNAKREAGETQEVTQFHWTDRLKRDHNGTIIPNELNILGACIKAPEMKDLFAYDEFLFKILLLRRPPWNTDDSGEEWQVRRFDNNDETMFAIWLQSHGINVRKSIVFDVVRSAAMENRRNCRKEYLKKCKEDYDSVPRLDLWLTLYLGVADTPYTRKIGRWWLISGVARVMNPGEKVDYCLNLEGGQGAGKSTVGEILAGGPQLFWDCSDPLNHKDTWLNLQGHAIVELAELANVRKSNAEDVKAFMTKKTDKFRAPFDRLPDEHPRQCIFIGTVNKLADYLVDDTGNRRFWPATVGNIDLEALRRDCPHLWAEAVLAWEKKEKWYPVAGTDDEFIAAAKEEADDRTVIDPWTDDIRNFLQYEGHYTVEGFYVKTLTRERLLSPVTVAAIAHDCLHIPVKDKHPGVDKRIAQVLQYLGYDQRQSRSPNGIPGEKPGRQYVLKSSADS